MIQRAMVAAGPELGAYARLDRLAFSRMRSAHRGSTFSRRRRAHGGARLAVELDSTASVRLRFDRVRSGRLVGERCRAATAKTNRRPACRRFVARGSWSTFTLPEGRSTIWLTGRVHGRRLPPGRYRVRMRSALRVATPASATFRVVR